MVMDEVDGLRAGRVKVIHVITKLELGGAQEITLHTVSHLPAGRFAPSLIAGVGGIMDQEAAALPGVSVHLMPSLVRDIRPWKDVRALLALRRRFRSERPLVVHTHSSKAGILGRWAAWLAGVPVIVHSIHGFGFNDHQPKLVRKAYELAERMTARITTGFTADAQANLDRGEPLGIFRDRSAIVLRCAIRPERFSVDPGEVGQLRQELGIPFNDKVVGMVACLKPQKAPLDFVRAASRVSQSRPDTSFFIAGDGILMQAVKDERRALGLQGKLHLLGWRRDVPALLHLCDIVTLSSLWEGLPRVFPQAMACGKPIVANRVDGAPEAVEDGVTGYLVDPGRPAELADRLTRLLGDDELRHSMGREALRRIPEFTVDHMMEIVVRFYEDLLEQSGRGDRG